MAAPLTDQSKHNAQSCKAIFQTVLDLTSDALMAFDQEVLTAHVGLPVHMRTQTSKFTLETHEQVLSGLKVMQQSFKAQGVNHYIRLLTHAEYLSEDYIEGHYITHTLRNAVPVVPAFPNRAILRRKDDQWQFTQVDSAMQNAKWPISTPRIKEGETPFWQNVDHSLDARRADQSALTLYQDFLNALTDTNHTHDFDGWCALNTFPHYVHMENVDKVIETEAQIQPFFEMISTLLREHGFDRLERIADHAEFLSGDTICGYHKTNFYTGDTAGMGPVDSRMILKREDTDWKMYSVTNSVANDQFPYSFPELCDGIVTIEKIQERTRK